MFAAVFAVQQYLQARQDQRVARALDYVERFQDSGTSVGAARQRLSAEIWKNAADIAVLREVVPTLPPEEVRALLFDFEQKVLSTPELRDDLHVIAQFLDALEICVAAGLCDEAATLAFFGGYVETLWGNFERTIGNRRGLDRDYGFGVEALVRRGRKMVEEEAR